MQIGKSEIIITCKWYYFLKKRKRMNGKKLTKKKENSVRKLGTKLQMSIYFIYTSHNLLDIWKAPLTTAMNKIKCPGIYFIRTARSLCKNVEMLRKDSEEQLNKWRGTPCSRKTRPRKGFSSSRLICNFNVVPLNSKWCLEIRQGDFRIQVEKLKIEQEETWNSKKKKMENHFYQLLKDITKLKIVQAHE